MRKIMLALVVGLGVSALATGGAQAHGYHHHWRHHVHYRHWHNYYHHPVFFSPDYYDYYPDYPDYSDHYWGPGYAPYYPGLFFGFGFGGHHHWHH